MTLEQQLAWQTLSEFLAGIIEGQPPRFPLGGTVQCFWTDENGQCWVEHGLIVGVYPAPKGWLAGWWYVVRFDQNRDSPWVELPCFDDWHESGILMLSDEDFLTCQPEG